MGIWNVSGSATVTESGDTIGTTNANLSRGISLWEDGTSLVSINGPTIGGNATVAPTIGIYLDDVSQAGTATSSTNVSVSSGATVFGTTDGVEVLSDSNTTSDTLSFSNSSATGGTTGVAASGSTTSLTLVGSAISSSTASALVGTGVDAVSIAQTTLAGNSTSSSSLTFASGGSLAITGAVGKNTFYVNGTNTASSAGPANSITYNSNQVISVPGLYNGTSNLTGLTVTGDDGPDAFVDAPAATAGSPTPVTLYGNATDPGAGNYVDTLEIVGTTVTSPTVPNGSLPGYALSWFYMKSISSTPYSPSTPFSITFGPIAAAGYINEPASLYNGTTNTMGWVGTNASSYTLSGSTPQLENATYAGATAATRTFRLDDLTPGTTYYLTATMGQYGASASPSETMSISVPVGTLVGGVTTLTTNAASFTTATFVVTPNSSGTVELALSNTVGQPNWVINTLNVVPASSENGITITRSAPDTNPLSTAVPADGSTVDTYLGTVSAGASAAGEIITIMSSAGTITGATNSSDTFVADNNSTYGGVQAVVDSTGHFEFTLQRPASGSSAVLTAQDVNGASSTMTSVGAQPYSQSYSVAVAPTNFTFGSVAAAGYTNVPSTLPLYNGTSNSFGWVGTNASSYTLSGSTPQLENSTYAGATAATRIFRVDNLTASTTYYATVTMGQYGASGSPSETMNIGVPLGTLVGGTTSLTAAGAQFVTGTVVVTTTGSGSIELSFSSSAGQPNWVINTLNLVKQSNEHSIVISRVDSSPLTTPVAANGSTDDVYEGTGAVAGEVITVSASGGTLIGATSATGTSSGPFADNNSTYAGIQAVANGSGNFYFELQRPTSTAPVTLAAQDVNGVSTTLTSSATQPYVQDYSAASLNITFGPIAAAGYINEPATLYNGSTNSMGWVGTNAYSYTLSGASAQLENNTYAGATDATRIFRIDNLAASTEYALTITMGQYGATASPAESMNISVPLGTYNSGSTSFSVNGANHGTNTLYATTTAGGSLELQFSNSPSTPNWVINTLGLVPQV
jgi:hypothetical protein